MLSLLVECEVGFGSEELAESLFRRSESWMTEDLELSDVWIIGLSAYADAVFKARLEAYLNSFRSPFAPRKGSLRRTICFHFC